MPEFEDAISSSDSGYPVSWFELRTIAADLCQAHDCLIVAAESPHGLSRRIAERGFHPELLVKIEALDSTEWRIQIRDDIDGYEEVRKLLSSLK
ncbi:hypothetical protein ACIBF7_44920 [Nonomuraea sp. NPDC050478]|uniref:hypothetical protein n=1 Tax=Nonomuraea sp. NPDC050478 TaxID=3364365 RepID=UPI0037BD7850